MEELRRPAPIADLLCPPQTSVLSLIRRVVATVLREIGRAAEEANLIEIPVHEACTKVIHRAHGNPLTENGEHAILRVQICPAPDHVTIRVTDASPD